MRKISWLFLVVITAGLFVTAFAAEDEIPLLSAQCNVTDGVSVSFLVSTVQGNQFIHCNGFRAVSGVSHITLVNPTAWLNNPANVTHLCSGPVNGACRVTYK